VTTEVHPDKYKEGIQQAKEALDLYRQFNHVIGQAQALEDLSWLLFHDKQLDATEEAALQAINLFSDEDNKFLICSCYLALGNICCSKGEPEKATNYSQDNPQDCFFQLA